MTTHTTNPSAGDPFDVVRTMVRNVRDDLVEVASSYNPQGVALTQIVARGFAEPASGLTYLDALTFHPISDEVITGLLDRIATTVADSRECVIACGALYTGALFGIAAGVVDNPTAYARKVVAWAEDAINLVM